MLVNANGCGHVLSSEQSNVWGSIEKIRGNTSPPTSPPKESQSGAGFGKGVSPEKSIIFDRSTTTCMSISRDFKL